MSGRMTPYGKSFQTVEKLLSDGKSRDVETIVKDLVLTGATVREALRLLRNTKRAHVAAWGYSDYGRPMPVWKIGAGADAPRIGHRKRPPEVRTPRQILAAERNHRQQIEQELANPPFRHWQDAAMFGPASVVKATILRVRRIQNFREG